MLKPEPMSLERIDAIRDSLSLIDCNTVIKAVEDCLAEIDRLKAENQWISVDERLPEEIGEYLILPYVRHVPTLCWQEGWYWYDRIDDAISDTLGHNMDDPLPKVTHWKSLNTKKV